MNTEQADPMREARLAVLAAVANGDSGLAFELVGEMMGNGVSFDSVLFDVIAPLQRDMGRRWQHGDVGISEEHVSTGSIETLVALLAGSLGQPEDGRHVAVACAEGDPHSLPARIVAAYLLYAGFRVTFLGAQVPAVDLGTFLADLEPEALVLSCAVATRLPGARDCIRAAHGAGIPVVAGGRGFGSDAGRATALGADAWVAHPTDLDAVLETWEPDVAAAEKAANDRTLEIHDLEAVAHRVTTTATSEAIDALDQPAGAAPGRIAADVRQLFDTLVAALLVGDQGVVDEFAHWHQDLRTPTDIGDDATGVLLAALRNAIGDVAPTGRRYLDDALGSLQL